MRTLLLSIAVSLSYLIADAQTWLSLNGGLSCTNTGLIYEIEYDELNQILLATGNFHYDIDCNEVYAVAYWNGQVWTTYPPNCGYFNKRSVEQFDNEIYVLTQMNCSNDSTYLYHLENDLWTAIPDGPNIESWSELEVIDDVLYGGCGFDNLGNTPAKVLFSYDGTAFTPLVTEQLDSMEVTGITSITEYHDTLYVGGGFDCNNCTPTDRLNSVAAVYDGALHQVGVGLNSFYITEALCVHRDTLFIGGNFESNNFPGFSDNQNIHLLTYANGELKPYPIQPNQRITALKSYHDLLFVGGWFDMVEGEINPCVFGLNGTEVISINSEQFFNSGGQAVNSVRDIEIYNDTLYVAGGWKFIGESEVPFGGIAKLNLSLSSLVGVNESERHGEMFQLFPNPTNTNVHLLFVNESNNRTIFVYDMTGRVIYQSLAKGLNQTFDVAQWSSGLYTIRVLDENQTASATFVKQ